MSKKRQTENPNRSPGQGEPWYRHFWVWFIIALPASAVIAGIYTLWLAVSNPDHLVVDEEEYQRLKSELKAQQAEPQERDDSQSSTDGSGRD